MSLRDIVAAGAGVEDSAEGFRRRSPANVLAWLAYVLSIMGIAGNPSDIAPHGFTGCSAQGPEGGSDYLILLVRAEGRYQVASQPLAADDLLGARPRDFDESIRGVRTIAQRLLDEGNELLGAARGAAAASPW